MRSLLFALVQAAGCLAALAGVYGLFGLAWALLVGGALLVAAGTAAEYLTARPVARPRPRKD